MAKLSRSVRLYVVALAAVGCATIAFWLIRDYVNEGQASLLYLPVVIGCAIYLGFGPSAAAAVASFVCWDYFFLPPYRALIVANPKDWLSLIVFLVTAVTTARLASNARDQAEQARAREDEIAVLFEASETLSREVSLDQVIAALSEQLGSLCRIAKCAIWRTAGQPASLTRLLPSRHSATDEAAIEPRSRQLAEAAARNRQVIGFDPASRAIWEKAAGKPDGLSGAYIPLQTEKQVVGVLEIGQRSDGKAFSSQDQRLILTLANHVAVVLARESLAEQAAQAEALRKADILKDSLLSMVSHELRSPLAAIKATASGLASSLPESSLAADDLRVINGEVDRLTGIVGNLLDLSRLEGGAWRPERDWCDIGEIVATSLDRLPDADAQRIKFEIASDMPLIRVDYTQIALVVTNLLQNAIKYTPDLSPIELSAAQSWSGGQDGTNHAAVVIRVRDFGPGISPGDEQLIFTRFYRSAAHQRSTIRGTGLGLALCEAVVRAHGGRIWAMNAPSGEPSGAILCVSLPLELAVEEPVNYQA